MRCFQILQKALLLWGVAWNCLAVHASPENGETDSTLTDHWVVRTSGEPLPASTLKTWNAQDLGVIGALDGFFTLDFSKSPMEADEIERALTSEPTILWHERQNRNLHASPQAATGNPTNNPSFGEAWHITNAGLRYGRRGEDLNLLPAWDWGLSGSGVLIAVIDTGVDMDHPDLEANIRSDLALNLNGSPVTDNDTERDPSHGTAVSGIITAVDNQIGSVGVAYGAHIVPIRYIGKSHTDAESAQALSHQHQIVAIYNNSWGPAVGSPDDDLVGMVGHDTLGNLALATGVRQGRAGRGNLFVFAAGNDHELGSNVNYNSWANSRYTIAVGAIGNAGTRASYSETGAPLLISAPSGGQTLGIFTTDRVGSRGYNPLGDYTSNFSGTSAAAPMVSGVIALMLEANPLLGWRDVQHILAKTAVRVDADDEGWQQNGAGLYFNDQYGFGRVDASAAIQASVVWSNVGPEVSTTASRNVSQFIPSSGTPLQSSIEVSRNLRIEQVILTPRILHSDWGDLRITLISPSGTESVLSHPHDDAIGSYAEWDFSSVQFWDESSMGTWTLRIEDLDSGGTGSLNRWNLRIFGTELDDRRNRAPMALDDRFIQTDFSLPLPVLANDSDPDGDALSIISLYQGEVGEVSITPNQELQYTPDPSQFLGIDRIGYTIADGRGGTSNATVQVIHPGPVALPDQAVVSRGGSVSIPILLNDFDRSDDAIRVLEIENPANGTAVLEGDLITYTPVEDFIGHESFRYTITDDTHGEFSTTVRVFTSADSDFALLFDGNNDAVRFEDRPAYNLTQSLTLEGSFYLRSYGEFGDIGYGRILDRDTYSLFVNGTNNSFYPDHCLVFAIEMPDGTLVAGNSPKGSIALNRWYRVAATYDGQQIHLFIDGKPVEVELNVDSFGGPLASREHPLFIGERQQSDRAFDGVIDWVRLWNVARDADSIRQTSLFVEESDRSGLVGWFQFNEGVGPSTVDSMQDAPDGVLSGPLWVPKDPSMLSTSIQRNVSE